MSRVAVLYSFYSPNIGRKKINKYMQKHLTQMLTHYKEINFLARIEILVP